MDGLKNKKYLHVTRKRFDPLALGLSAVGLVAVFASLGSLEESRYFLDIRSVIVVVGGTLASLLFQFDFSSSFTCLKMVILSFLGTPEKRLLHVLQQLDDAILTDKSLEDLRDGDSLNGEILNDVVYMKRSGLLFDEIDEFVTSRISDLFFNRKASVAILQRAALVAPALGLFGTVVGLIGVLKSLKDPSQIGQSMSLALMTTAYGAGLGSLVFTPLAGRLEHHNAIFLEVHQRLMSKIGILMVRDERNMSKVSNPDLEAA